MITIEPIIIPREKLRPFYQRWMAPSAHELYVAVFNGILSVAKEITGLIAFEGAEATQLEAKFNEARKNADMIRDETSYDEINSLILPLDLVITLLSARAGSLLPDMNDRLESFRARLYATRRF